MITQHKDGSPISVNDVDETCVAGVEAHKLWHGLEERLGGVQPGDASQFSQAPLDHALAAVTGDVSPKGVSYDVKVLGPRAQVGDEALYELRDLQTHQPRVGGRLTVERPGAASPIDGYDVEVVVLEQRLGQIPNPLHESVIDESVHDDLRRPAGVERARGHGVWLGRVQHRGLKWGERTLRA